MASRMGLHGGKGAFGVGRVWVTALILCCFLDETVASRVTSHVSSLISPEGTEDPHTRPDDFDLEVYNEYSHRLGFPESVGSNRDDEGRPMLLSSESAQSRQNVSSFITQLQRMRGRNDGFLHVSIDDGTAHFGETTFPRNYPISGSGRGHFGNLAWTRITENQITYSWEIEFYLDQARDLIYFVYWNATNQMKAELYDMRLPTALCMDDGKGVVISSEQQRQSCAKVEDIRTPAHLKLRDTVFRNLVQNIKQNYFANTFVETYGTPHPIKEHLLGVHGCDKLEYFDFFPQLEREKASASHNRLETPRYRWAKLIHGTHWRSQLENEVRCMQTLVQGTMSNHLHMVFPMPVKTEHRQLIVAYWWMQNYFFGALRIHDNFKCYWWSQCTVGPSALHEIKSFAQNIPLSSKEPYIRLDNGEKVKVGLMDWNYGSDPDDRYDGRRACPKYFTMGLRTTVYSRHAKLQLAGFELRMGQGTAHVGRNTLISLLGQRVPHIRNFRRNVDAKVGVMMDFLQGLDKSFKSLFIVPEGVSDQDYLTKTRAKQITPHLLNMEKSNRTHRTFTPMGLLKLSELYLSAYKQFEHHFPYRKLFLNPSCKCARQAKKMGWGVYPHKGMDMVKRLVVFLSLPWDDFYNPNMDTASLKINPRLNYATNFLHQIKNSPNPAEQLSCENLANEILRKVFSFQPPPPPSNLMEASSPSTSSSR